MNYYQNFKMSALIEEMDQHGSAHEMIHEVSRRVKLLLSSLEYIRDHCEEAEEMWKTATHGLEEVHAVKKYKIFYKDKLLDEVTVIAHFANRQAAEKWVQSEEDYGGHGMTIRNLETKPRLPLPTMGWRFVR